MSGGGSVRGDVRRVLKIGFPANNRRRTLTTTQQRSASPVVIWLMRSVLPIGLAALIVGAGCARPVLYYPTPESAGVSPPKAGATTTASPVATAAVTTSAPVATTMSADVEYLVSRHILLPVAGADISKVEDTFFEGRDGDRVHRALDILAPRGTPILSADDGKILRMSTSALGGICMYTIDAQSRLVYYYAHMDHYNDAMSPGRSIVRGDTLGFVGTTGNAPKDTPHLHFQVMRWATDGKYWNGEPIDAYEALGGVMKDHRRAGQPDER
jgi:peptidoglycan LD-endopeptidase LytH